MPLASDSPIQADEASVAALAVIALPNDEPDEPDFSESDYERSLITYPPMFPTRQQAVSRSVGTKRTGNDK